MEMQRRFRSRGCKRVHPRQREEPMAEEHSEDWGAPLQVASRKLVQPTTKSRYTRLSDGLQRLLGLRASCRTVSSHERRRPPLGMLKV